MTNVIMNKPYSESCEQNKTSILSVISPVFSRLNSVLEIGSGTGQHAVHFSQKMPHLKWHTSDCQPYLEGIDLRLKDACLSNVYKPFELDVSLSPWPAIKIDAVFSANTLHIMHRHDVVNFMKGVGKLLSTSGCLMIYGPFNYKGSYTSDSNEAFDHWLKNRDSLSGIKNFEDIEVLAKKNFMRLVKDYTMPANNRILYFVKN